MGAGIAQVAAQAGHTVVVFDTHEPALARGEALVGKNLQRQVERGQLSADRAAALAARFRWSPKVSDLSSCGLVIEAIFENFDAKTALFAEVEAVVAPGAVLASNTSSLSITALGSRLARPAQFLGLHFFNPAPVMKLIEVVPGLDTDPALTPAALALMKSWGKIALTVKDTPGFIVNRVARPYYSEGWRAYEEGVASAASLDFVYRDLAGFRMGPLELGDTIGHDINFMSARSVYEAYFGRTRFAPSVLQGQLVAAGKLGRKSGSGVYVYAPGAEAPAPAFTDTATGRADSSVLIQPSDGRTAAEVAAANGRSVAVLDHSANPAATAIAFAASDDKARAAALAYAAAEGKKAVELADRPGLVVLRTLLQLTNGAADAVRDGVGAPEAIDLAMRNGVNYPFGLFDWGAGYGWTKVVEALEAVARGTGDAMYAPSEVLRKLAT
jgi:3-hydroxybutyryl-CoA dehydrogenase